MGDGGAREDGVVASLVLFLVDVSEENASDNASSSPWW